MIRSGSELSDNGDRSRNSKQAATSSRTPRESMMASSPPKNNRMAAMIAEETSEELSRNRSISRAATMSRGRNRSRTIDAKTADPDAENKNKTIDKRKSNVPKALQDPRVRKQLREMKDYRPWFLTFTSVIQIFMMAYAVFLNSGFENFLVNPLFGPSSTVLIQLGAKYVPCMRPDYETSPNTIVPW
jgi:hypothetical protein